MPLPVHEYICFIINLQSTFFKFDTSELNHAGQNMRTSVQLCMFLVCASICQVCVCVCVCPRTYVQVFWLCCHSINAAILPYCAGIRERIYLMPQSC